MNRRMNSNNNNINIDMSTMDSTQIPAVLGEFSEWHNRPSTEHCVIVVYIRLIVRCCGGNITTWRHTVAGAVWCRMYFISATHPNEHGDIERQCYCITYIIWDEGDSFWMPEVGRYRLLYGTLMVNELDWIRTNSLWCVINELFIL